MKFGLEYHNITSISLVFKSQEVSRLQEIVQLPSKIVINDLFKQKLFATKFNFPSSQIILFSLVVLRFPVVFDLLMKIGM